MVSWARKGQGEAGWLKNRGGGDYIIFSFKTQHVESWHGTEQ